MSTPFKLYAHRYLKPKINARTRYIIRTVCAVADEGFDKKLGIRKAKPFYEKLKSTPTTSTSVITQMAPSGQLTFHNL